MLRVSNSIFGAVAFATLMAGQSLGTILRKIRTMSDRQCAGCSDAELLGRFIANRDESAFELLVWRHGKLVLGVCRRYEHARPLELVPAV